MIDKYKDLARELNKLWNMMVIVILIKFGVLGMVNKGLEKKPRSNKDYSDHTTVNIS